MHTLLHNLIQRVEAIVFIKDETGAVTVDWVVLAAAAVAFGAVASTVLTPYLSAALETVANDIASGG